jgi:hypothetical protein
VTGRGAGRVCSCRDRKRLAPRLREDLRFPRGSDLEARLVNAGSVCGTGGRGWKNAADTRSPSANRIMDRFPRALTPPPLPPPRRVVRHFTPAPPNYGDFPRVSTEASCADARALLESFETLTSLTVCPRPRHPTTTTRHPPPASRGP